MSKRDAPIDIISMAQQARPKVIGQIEFLRTQLTTLSSDARMTALVLLPAEGHAQCLGAFFLGTGRGFRTAPSPSQGSRN